MSSRFLRLSRFLAPGQPDWVARATTLCIGGTLLGVGLGALGLRHRGETGEVPVVVAVASTLGFGLALVSLGSVFAVAAIKKVRTGRSENYNVETATRMEPVARSRSPGVFWFDVVMCWLLAVALYVAALALVIAVVAEAAKAA